MWTEVKLEGKCRGKIDKWIQICIKYVQDEVGNQTLYSIFL